LAKIKESPKKHFIAEINPEIEDIVNQALAIAEEGDIKKAQDILIDLKNKHLRENYMICFGLGVVYAFKANHDEAIRYFEKSVEIFPYLAEAHFNMGIAYQKKFDIKNAVKSFREVLAIDKSEDYMVKQSRDFIKRVEQMVKKTMVLIWKHILRLMIYLTMLLPVWKKVNGKRLWRDLRQF